LKNGIIINAPSFWPSFLISQRKLWPSLGAVKLELISRQGGILPGSLRLDFPSKKGNKGKIGHLNRGFSFYLSVPR
jgi:hypothetical protein